MSKSKNKRPLNFAVIGMGFIFDRHAAAIDHIGGKLLMACDIDEEKSMKIDSDVEFFSDPAKMVLTNKFNEEVDWVVICTPNGSHKALIERMARRGKNVLCEKPLVISVEDLEDLEKVAERWNTKIYTVMQLRESKRLQELKESLPEQNRVEINLAMKRGEFYWKGWKGDSYVSGGLLFNIGVHYFDLLLWLFGSVLDHKVAHLEMKAAEGSLELERASVSWSINLRANKDNQYRVFEINGDRINLTRILENLHNKVYEQLLEGKGTSLSEVAPVITLCEAMTKSYDS